MAEVVAFRTQGGATFSLSLGAVLADTPSTVLRRAERVDGQAELPENMVVKLGRQPADFGRLDLEQVACERLTHTNLSAYWGSARTPELGTVLAFERLEANPLLVLNSPSLRPVFRDPETYYYPLPPGTALELASDVLHALEHVHARGFVHGGVTLTNLLVRTPQVTKPRDLLGYVAEGKYQGVLAGLGGARELTFLEALRQGQVDLDLTPRLPAFVSPPEACLELVEQGGRRVYSQSMDVYAFGLLLYTLLTGRRPYSHLVTPDELDHGEVISELKLRESRGDITPCALRALHKLPLHDSPLEGNPQETWPPFHAGVRAVIRGCTALDPDARPSPARLRELFTEDLRVHKGADTHRAYVQRTFQWLPGYNRLRGDRPLRGGLWVRDLYGTLAVEETTLPEREAAKDQVDLPFEEDPGTTISLRPSTRPAAPRVKRRIEAPLPLRDFLRAVHDDAPFPAPGPYLLTSTALDRASLAKCQVHALGTAASWVVVGKGGGVHEETRLVIGRAVGSDIVVPDPQVSKKHAELTFDRSSGRWQIKDLRSANGTDLDSEELTPGRRYAITRSGARLLFGESSPLIYMEKPALREFLGLVLNAANEAMAEARRAKQQASGPLPQPAAAPAAPDAVGPSSSDVVLADRSQAPDEEPASPLEGSSDSQPAFAEEASTFADDPYTYVPTDDDDPVSFVPEPPPEPEVLSADPPTARAPTRKIKRPTFARGKPRFPIARHDAAREKLSKKLAPHLEAGATIWVVMKGGARGTASDVDAVLKILATYGARVVRIEAEQGGERTVVFSREA